MAEKLGVSLRTVQHWEAGEFVPRGKQLRNIAARCGVSVAHLLGEEPSYGAHGLKLRAAGEDELIRQRCHEHLESVLDACAGDRDRLSWTYVELTKHFPLPSNLRVADAARRGAKQAVYGLKGGAASK